MMNFWYDMTPEEIFSDERSVGNFGFDLGDELAFCFSRGIKEYADTDESPKNLIDELRYCLIYGFYQGVEEYENLNRKQFNENIMEYLRLQYLLNYFSKKENNS
jgi:hypothetical protein